MLRYFLLLIILIGFTNITNNSASACECEDLQKRTPYLLNSDYIFLGKVKSIEKTNDKFVSYLVKFDVDKMWNGSSTKEIAIKASLDTGSCGYPFAVNQTVVVHASKEDKILHEKGCGTLPVEYVTDYIRFLDENLQNIREEYVKYDLLEELFTLPEDLKKIPLPSEIRQPMLDWCEDSSSSVKNDPRFWDAVPIRILSIIPEFQSSQGKTNSIVINSYVAEESCPPFVEMLGTFASENGDKHSFALSYDANFFMYQIDKTYSLELQSLAPLKQYKAGIPAKYVSCKEGLQLVIKSSTGTPACMDWENGKKLLKSGWAKSAPMISNIVCDSNCSVKLEAQGHTCYKAAKNTNFCTNKISQRISEVVIPYSASSPDGKNYIPNSITVSIGVNNTVIWTNVDEVSHTIVGDKEEFRSPPIFPNKTWTFTFGKVGEYGYHGEPGPWLRGKVTVLPVDMEFNKGMPLENWGGEPFLGRYTFRETDSLGYVDKVSILNDNSVMVSLSYPNGTEKKKLGLGKGFVGSCYEMNPFYNVKTFVLEEIYWEQKIAQFREELEQTSKNCNELFE